jgi:hypothetical protein
MDGLTAIQKVLFVGKKKVERERVGGYKYCQKWPSEVYLLGESQLKVKS